MVYYNEFDPYAAQWLRNLIAAHLIPDGIVDDRSIVDVKPQDLASYAQCHFFAGIAGWSCALQLTDWPASRPVWTGSCPCQPFSCAGKRKGTSDARHLWPEFYRLIKECRPATVFGEQVASKDGLRWLDGVFDDLEGADYAVGACDICVAGVGAPHIRQRLFWVAHAGQQPGEWRTGGLPEAQARVDSAGSQHGGLPVRFADGSEVGRLAQSPNTDRRIKFTDEPQPHAQVGGGSNPTGLAHSEIHGRDQGRPISDGRDVGAGCISNGLAHDDDARPQRRLAMPQCPNQRAPWPSSMVILCRDGKTRRISAEPGDVPLAYGIPRDLRPLRTTLERMGYSSKEVRRMLRQPRSLLAMAGRSRVGRLKGYGNAIVPQVAAEFIRACMP